LPAPARMKLSILIPAYQEQSTICLVLRDIVDIARNKLGCEIEVIVCDDGSSDGTAHEVSQLQRENRNIKLVSHARNCGKGAAIRTALAYATGDYVLIQDADREYDISVCAAMVQRACAGADVVYASRFLWRAWPAGMRLANYVANRVLTATANCLFGLGITDEATALKLFKTTLLRSLDLTCQRFEFCAEVTAKLGLLGVPIVEVPVKYRVLSARVRRPNFCCVAPTSRRTAAPGL
jgi:dolichol-phosphate mannosyltransferase